MIDLAQRDPTTKIYNPYKKDISIPDQIRKKNKKVSVGSEYYLKEDNIKKMIEAAKSLRNRIVIRLLGITGGRRFEVRDMRIQDIDFENKRIWIDRGKGGDPKGTTPEQRRSRWVDIDDEALITELKMCIGKRTKGKIIQSHSKKTDGIDLSGINRITAQTADLVGIKHPNPSPKVINGEKVGHKILKRHINPHLFRHTMGRRDMTLSAKQKLLGHKDARTTLQMYGQLTFEDAQKQAKEARDKTKEAPKKENQVYCKSCGKEISADSKFCKYCGGEQ